VPRDPWDNPYIYVSPGVYGDYDIISLGADGEEGGEGNDADIRSWEID
jgi:general secretion pathway protein G